jgi:putative transposase
VRETVLDSIETIYPQLKWRFKMATKTRFFIDNGCVHIMARGNQRQTVFNKSEDYSTYLNLLIKYKKKYSFKIYGYCLMPNHIHIIGQVEKAIDLSKFMQSLSRAYTACFNHKYQKVGHLWQGRFKSKILIKDEYFINCINYIECNPVRAKITYSPDKYRYSSYNERNMLGSKTTILDPIML